MAFSTGSETQTSQLSQYRPRRARRRDQTTGSASVRSARSSRFPTAGSGLTPTPRSPPTYFWTESSISGTDDSDDFASTTNHDDWSHAWVFGGGVMIPFGKSIGALNLGARYLLRWSRHVSEGGRHHRQSRRLDHAQSAQQQDRPRALAGRRVVQDPTTLEALGNACSRRRRSYSRRPCSVSSCGKDKQDSAAKAKNDSITVRRDQRRDSLMRKVACP